MTEIAKEILPVNIEEEMKQSYLDYAMSVIVGRALPDARDGLKPVHRRVLFAMNELGLDWNKAFKKSARVCGDTTGKFHPHGEQSVYDALVRMAQPFSMRAMLVDGQGNFGSVDGDSAAAMRYTEVRLSRIAHEQIADLDTDTVDFADNYDGSEREPAVFPTRVPNLLVNGSSGIAVGMATNIPPHNLGEVVDACLAYVDDPDIDIDGLMKCMPGPDFPTAGLINGNRGIREAYHPGRGRIQVRARAHFEDIDKSARQSIIVTELPYQVNKARLVEKIAELVKDKRLEGISGLRDESDKDGMRVVVELRRGEQADVVLNNLFQHTQMQTVFGINLVALVDGQPRLLNLKRLVETFVRHRREVVTRRTLFDLRKARDRAHVLEGLAVALANIDPVIALIKASANPADAKQGLMDQTWPPGGVAKMLDRARADTSRPEGLGAEFGLVSEGYRLSAVQAQAILDLRLHRLTGLEQEKILSEYDEILGRIKDLLEILENPERMRSVIRGELEALKDQYADARRTEIIVDHLGLDPEDLIAPEEVVVTLSHSGYVKWQPIDVYAAQKRGGMGKSATSMKEEDFVDQLFVANTHDTILCFSSRGKMYWLRVYNLPQASRTARGKPIVNLLPLEDGERISAVLPLKDFEQSGFVLMATASGVVKKTPLQEFSRPRAAGIIAIDLVGKDRLVGVAITDGERDVMLASSDGKMIRFNEREVRPMGRNARGVIGMRIPEDQRIISLIITGTGRVLTATEHGFGKCTNISEYRPQGRGGQGIISIQTSKRNGNVIGALLVDEGDEMMLITSGGKLVRTRVDEVSVLGRNTQGVRLIRLREGERLVGMERVEDEE
ncbi:MAG: DNA gyrase subunit A [Gammaproteobacteria bacterium]|nr:DNA gyrase subunit A [Gammaproteobacteria bacterium]MDX2459599.1 DNA gyrase subunit A [Gammaproteobacteria bacterium]